MLSRLCQSGLRSGSRLASVCGPNAERIVTVSWDDGRRCEFPLIWLRDTSPDKATYTLQAAMKARNLTMRDFDVEQEAKIVWTDQQSNELVVEWKTGLTSRFPSSWLEFRSFNDETRNRRRKVYLFPETTWGKSEIEQRLKRFSHDEVIEDDKALHDFLEAVCLDGVALLKGTPKGERGAVETIGRRIGLIKQTHFGVVFEVSTKSDASNMAYASNSELPFHTDFPSLSRPPELQMLHMLQRAEEGGNSLFVDGFHVAEQLRKERPEEFETLTTQSMEFIEEGYDVHDVDGRSQRFDYDMCARHKVIRLDDAGRVVKIQFGNAMRSWFYDCRPQDVQKLYRAMKTFTEYCYQPRNILKLHLDDGDTILWANTRLLHTRDAFRNASGRSRTLTGCYFDWDFVKSRVRCLRDRLDHPANQPSV